MFIYFIIRSENISSERLSPGSTNSAPKWEGDWNEDVLLSLYSLHSIQFYLDSRYYLFSLTPVSVCFVSYAKPAESIAAFSSGNVSSTTDRLVCVNEN